MIKWFLMFVAHLSQGTEPQVMAMMQFRGCVMARWGGIVSWGENRCQFSRKAVLLRVPESRSSEDDFQGVSVSRR